MEILQLLPADLMEEYKLCQQKAVSLADSLWKIALILGVGSVAGIITLSGQTVIPDGARPWIQIVLSIFAIGILLAWRSLAQRWWSIEQAMFRRMEHIERQSQLRANLYVGHLDGRINFASSPEGGTYDQPFLHPALLADFKTLRTYQKRGVQPIMSFVIETNIAVWVAFALFTCAPLLPKSIMLDGPMKLMVAIIFFLWWSWRLHICLGLDEIQEKPEAGSY